MFHLKSIVKNRPAARCYSWLHGQSDRSSFSLEERIVTEFLVFLIVSLFVLTTKKIKKNVFFLDMSPSYFNIYVVEVVVENRPINEGLMSFPAIV